MKAKQVKSTSKSNKYGMKIYSYIFLVIVLCYPNFAQSQDTLINRDLLIEDVRQMANILENSHPDPYINGGGKIVFHQRMQQILSSIPDSGMLKSDFFRLLGPFAALVGDAHTSLYDAYDDNWDFPGGIPLYFKVVEKSFYVYAVPDKKYEPLIGSVLISVEDIPSSQLIERQKLLKGCDNDYTALALLSKTGYLFFRDELQDIIPEWKETNKIRVKLLLSSGEIVEKSFDFPLEVKYPLIKPETSITLPSTKKCDFAYDFMGDEKQIAFLKIAHMTDYREDFELSGTSQTMDGLNKAWKRFYGTEPPEDVSEIIAGIPSAAETFKALVDEMRNAQTNTLIVDVRDNNGGNSMMMDFLWYFLFGKEKYLRLKGKTATDIVKLSQLYFENRPNANIENIGNDVSFPINENDYDFRYNCFHDPEKLERLNLEEILNYYFTLMPSFNQYYSSEQKESPYCPDKIVVLCNVDTFSGGYEIMWGLHKYGATIVGTPSGQAGNFFSDAIHFKLKNTGLKGQVSSKSQMLFPDDPVKGKVLMPDIELTYEYLKKCKFDKNAEVILALEKLTEIEKK